jgi:hypothetical protein
LKEADAWRALLGLHTSTVAATQQLARGADTATGEAALYDEKVLDSEAREAAYCAALTGLANQCDALLQEAMRTVEVQCINDIVRSHSNEVLAVGQSLASNGALNVSSTTAELRMAIQNQRSQIAQLRMLASAVKGAKELPLPRGTKLVIGVRQSGAGSEAPPLRAFALDDLLESVYSTAREVNETSIAEALARMLALPSGGGGQQQQQQQQHAAGTAAGSATALDAFVSTAPAAAVEPGLQFARRSAGDRGAVAV